MFKPKLVFALILQAGLDDQQFSRLISITWNNQEKTEPPKSL